MVWCVWKWAGKGEMFGNCWPRGIILGVCECVSECVCGVVWCGVCGNGLARGKCLGTAGREVSYWVCVSV